jgi:hypothetical protein
VERFSGLKGVKPLISLDPLWFGQGLSVHVLEVCGVYVTSVVM